MTNFSRVCVVGIRAHYWRVGNRVPVRLGYGLLGFAWDEDEVGVVCCDEENGDPCEAEL